MIHSTTDIDIPVSEEVIILDEQQPPKTNNDVFFTLMLLFQCLCHVFNLKTIRTGLIAPLRLLWACYFPRVSVVEEGLKIPCSLTFIINALLAFVEIKSQGHPGFPFQTHPRAIMVSVTSLLIYGMASAIKLGVSGLGLDHTSVYAIIACLGRIGALCVLLASLASLFYF